MVITCSMRKEARETSVEIREQKRLHRHAAACKFQYPVKTRNKKNRSVAKLISDSKVAGKTKMRQRQTPSPVFYPYPMKTNFMSVIQQIQRTQIRNKYRTKEARLQKLR
jgi:hypothetical protein